MRFLVRVHRHATIVPSLEEAERFVEEHAGPVTARLLARRARESAGLTQGTERVRLGFRNITIERCS